MTQRQIELLYERARRAEYRRRAAHLVDTNQAVARGRKPARHLDALNQAAGG